jgi:hypothetical protein
MLKDSAAFIAAPFGSKKMSAAMGQIFLSLSTSTSILPHPPFKNIIYNYVLKCTERLLCGAGVQ